MINNLRTLRFSLLLILVLVSCQQDDNIKNMNSSSGFKTISFEDLQSQPKALQKINSIITSMESKSGVYDSKYRFTVNTDQILMFEDSGFQSFTFSITPDHDKGYVENLVLNLEEDGSYSVYCAIYNLTSQEKELLAQNKHVDLNRKSFLCPLPEFSTTTIIKSNQIGVPYMVNGGCYVIMFVRAGSWSNIPSQIEASIWIEQEVEIPSHFCEEENPDYSFTEYGGGGGPEPIPYFDTPVPVWEAPITDTDGPAGNWGNGGNQGDKPKPIITRPILKEPGIISDNCTDLKNKSDNAVFKAKLDELRGKAASQNFESGYVTYSDAQGNMSFSPELKGTGNNQLEGKAVVIDLTSGGASTDAINVVHSHLDDGSTYKIFTPADLYSFCRLVKESNKPASDLAMYVVTGSGTFALKVRDAAVFESYLINFLVNANALDKDFERYVKIDSPLDKQIKGFLKFMKYSFGDSDVNVDLYQLDVANNTWSNLELNDFESVKKRKCQ